MTTIEQLYITLHERRRPEDVAQMVLELTSHSLTAKERAVLEKAAKGSLARNVHGYTSMLQTFAEAIGAGNQIAPSGKQKSRVPENWQTRTGAYD